jgi:Right handed beta helix region/MYND finger
MDVLLKEFGAATLHPSPRKIKDVLPCTRQERINQWNEMADRSNTATCMSSTFDFVKKVPYGCGGINASLESLRPIRISDLEIGKTHRGCAVYCRIITRTLLSKSAMVLIEDIDDQSYASDDGDDQEAQRGTGKEITDLAVYGLTVLPQEFLAHGRYIAIMEPLYKMRFDGTPGIRVDNPSDIVLDVSSPSLSSLTLTEKRCGGDGCVTVEARLEEMVIYDPTMGVNSLYRALQEEGYIIAKRQIRALKISLKEKQKDGAASSALAATTGESTISIAKSLIPILSERRPEKHRILRSLKAKQDKQAGNEAFQARNFEQAEKDYTSALACLDEEKKGDQNTDKEGVNDVALWQLYGNRSAARLRQGKLEEAMQDSLASNMCAPADAIKPLLRCADTLTAMGFCKECIDLLDATAVEFPHEKSSIDQKKRLLAPSAILRVGPDKEFQTIARAVAFAAAGAEIIVDPGVYSESLRLTKPVTLRGSSTQDDYAAIRSLEQSGIDGKSSADWPEIRVKDDFAVHVHGNPDKPIHIIGFRIVSTGIPLYSFHAVFVSSGLAVVRNCVVTSSSGPVIAAQFASSRLIVQACAVHGGTQGGILVVMGAKLSLQQTHCCRHAAGGLELREGGTVVAESSHFYSNGRQGIMAWKSAGRLTAKHCVVHSNSQESGILVSEAEAVLESCRLYGNGAAGVVAQDKGSLSLLKCDVHDNCEGILIQDTGSARVEQCEVHSNRSNGIFVGFDHIASAAITDNHVHNNNSRGILVANKTGRVLVRGNVEHDNHGLPPQLGNVSGRTRVPSNKFYKRMKKNEKTIEKAFEQMTPCSFFDSVYLKYAKEHGVASVPRKTRDILQRCAFCRASEGEKRTTTTSGDGGGSGKVVVFSRCSRCKQVVYCCKQCQKSHWPTHQPFCKPEPVRYPTFLDNQKSV